MARARPLLRAAADFAPCLHSPRTRRPTAAHPLNHRPRPRLQAVEPGRCPTHAQRVRHATVGARLHRGFTPHRVPCPRPRPVQLFNQRPARFRSFAIFSLLIAMGIGMALTGCAGLPENVDRPVSRALADPSGTALASMVQEQKAAAESSPPFGVRAAQRRASGLQQPAGVGGICAEDAGLAVLTPSMPT